MFWDKSLQLVYFFSTDKTGIWNEAFSSLLWFFKKQTEKIYNGGEKNIMMIDVPLVY